MKSITFIVSEFGDAPYASAHRYNQVAKSIVNNKDSKRLKISVISCIGSLNIDQTKINYKVLQVNPRKGNLIYRFFKEIIYALFIIIKLSKIKKDLLVITIPNYFSSLILITYCRIFRIKYILDVRDLYPDVFAYANILKKNGLIFKLLLKLEINHYKKAEKVIVVTKGIRDILIERGIDKSKLRIIYNGYPIELSSHFKNNIEPKRDVVLHGTIGLMQNKIYIKELITGLPECQFTFIGGGSSFNFIRNLNLSNVKIYDRLSHKDTLRIVANHKIGLCIRTGSTYDSISLPVKIFEFLGLGMHIISFPKTEFANMPSVNKFIDEFDKFDAKIIKRRIEELIGTSQKSYDVPIELSREYNSELFTKILLKS